MTSILPKTTEEILRTGDIDPEFAETIKDSPPPSSIIWNVKDIKRYYESSLPERRKALEASRPEGLTESEHHIILRTGYHSRIIVCHKTVAPSSVKAPLILFFFGGGFCVGSPESEVELARELVLRFDAVVVLPSYRLAPEFPFPFAMTDAWDTLQWAAAESLITDSSILPSFTDARSGFIVGGTSSGAAISASLAHLARDHGLNPPLTGQALFGGLYISEYHVPLKYRPRYLSREQNANAPILTKQLHLAFRDAYRPELESPIYVPFHQRFPDDKKEEGVNGHFRICPAYFQACGMDMNRDDSLIYESVLREECDVPTRIDLYPGLPHCWWVMQPDLQSSKKRLRDTIDGFRWLLNYAHKDV